MLGIMNVNQNFRVRFDMTTFFLFAVVKTPLATILAKFDIFYLKQQLR